ncbi:hypothetical protein RRG08_005483 [Elysia crispata]|uniref:Secreted protein n=1 Tax=Elysia crispata TaxID=231223 RepID=A0AAE0Y2G4_9GAST|nr:hypothetical protein RRG08_005483 [Elysia crispata]
MTPLLSILLGPLLVHHFCWRGNGGDIVRRPFNRCIDIGFCGPQEISDHSLYVRAGFTLHCTAPGGTS